MWQIYVDSEQDKSESDAENKLARQAKNVFIYNNEH
jgi:hypothetical protein